MLNEKSASTDALLGGLERIRTAVGGFADPSLATRPRDHLGVQRYKRIGFFLQSAA